MLFQHGALFSAFSVLENIAFPLRELKTLPGPLIREAAMVKLQMVGLKPEDAEKMPSELSGGMIKRAALARALITKRVGDSVEVKTPKGHKSYEILAVRYR